jgi:hypothetical protein
VEPEEHFTEETAVVSPPDVAFNEFAVDIIASRAGTWSSDTPED